jgi:serine/threonine-protein kinase
MSFRVWKGEAAATPRQAAASTPPPPAFIPPDLAEAGANRLAVLALLSAVVSLLMAIANRQFLGRFGATSMNPTIWLLSTSASLLLSFSVAWIVWRKMLPSAALLDLGLIYEVAQAFCISLGFHLVPISPDAPPHGWTGVAVFILAYPLIVPSTRGKMILATLAAAAMDPLGLLVVVAAGNPRPPASLLLLTFLPTALSAGVAIVVSRLVYRMTVEAEKGHEMGSYHLEELLGRGGMGEVWRANHRLLARSAAIKLIRPESFGSDGRELVRRFEREAKATAALRSPHTVNIYDFGTTEDGTFYYVMELLEGFDLETLVSSFGPLPPERATHLLIQACHSLAEAHQGGLIHRDVKPANIYACRYGLDWDFVKVLDFGLVKNPELAAEDKGRPLTVAGVIAGTPGYMARRWVWENRTWTGARTSTRSPVVGYWLLTAKPVFDLGSSPMQVRDGPHPEAAAISIGAHDGPHPARARHILLRCLSKDPNDRPQTMQELAESPRQRPASRALDPGAGPPLVARQREQGHAGKDPRPRARAGPRDRSAGDQPQVN